MRATSVRQPYAEQIAKGARRIESCALETWADAIESALMFRWVEQVRVCRKRGRVHVATVPKRGGVRLC